MLKRRRDILYIGETANLKDWVSYREEHGAFEKISEMAEDRVLFAYLSLTHVYVEPSKRRGVQSYQIALKRPIWNCLAA